MKIVATDNLGRETVADKLVLSGIPDTPENRAKAEEFCTWANGFAGDDAYHGMFLRVYENEDRLSRGMEDLV